MLADVADAVSQLLDLDPQRGDVVPSLAQRGRELVVVALRLRQLAARLEHPLLEPSYTERDVLQSPPQ